MYRIGTVGNYKLFYLNVRASTTHTHTHVCFGFCFLTSHRSSRPTARTGAQQNVFLSFCLNHELSWCNYYMHALVTPH